MGATIMRATIDHHPRSPYGVMSTLQPKRMHPDVALVQPQAECTHP